MSAERRADIIRRPRLLVRNSFCINFKVPHEAIERHAAMSTLLMMCAKFVASMKQAFPRSPECSAAGRWRHVVVGGQCRVPEVSPFLSRPRVWSCEVVTVALA